MAVTKIYLTREQLPLWNTEEGRRKLSDMAKREAAQFGGRNDTIQILSPGGTQLDTISPESRR